MNCSASYCITRGEGMPPLLAAVFSNRVDVDHNGAREQWTRSAFAQYLAMAYRSKAYQVEQCRDPYMAENFSLELHREG